MEEREFHGIENEVCFKDNTLKVLWDSGAMDLRLFFLLSICVFCSSVFINMIMPPWLWQLLSCSESCVPTVAGFVSVEWELCSLSSMKAPQDVLSVLIPSRRTFLFSSLSTSVTCDSESILPHRAVVRDGSWPWSALCHAPFCLALQCILLRFFPRTDLQDNVTRWIESFAERMKKIIANAHQ